MAMEMPEPPEPKKTGHRWLDLIVALSALSISVVSIFVAQHTSETMERLVHASSWPFLQLGSGNVDDDGNRAIAFGLENVGTGPARIHTYSVQVDGHEISTDGHVLTNVLRACCNEEFDAAIARNDGNILAVYGGEVSSPVANRFLAINADVTAMRWPQTEANAELWRTLDEARQTGRITSSVCYCSVFDECWIAHSNSFPPEEVGSCEPGAPARSKGGH